MPSRADRCGPRRTTCWTMLGDASRCQVALVTLPETTPVSETVATAFTIEDRVGVKLAPVFVNAVDVDADAAELPATDDLLDAAIAGLDADRSVAAVLRRGSAVPQGASACAAHGDRRTRQRPSAAATARASRRRPARWSHCGAAGAGRSSRRTRRRRFEDPSMTRSGSSDTLQPVLDEATVVVCCGSGGVGKTTVAAAFGVEAAPSRPARRRPHDRSGEASRRCPRRQRPRSGTEPCRVPRLRRVGR